MKLLDSSLPNLFPISTASSIDTLSGISSRHSISKVASLNMVRSTPGILTIRQFLDARDIKSSILFLLRHTPRTNCRAENLIVLFESKFSQIRSNVSVGLPGL